MHPKNAGEEALPNFKPIADRKIDAILISHAHQDHFGTLPVLMRRQPDARVFMTEATAEIGNTLLHNSVNVMTRQREEIGTTLYPLFTHRETDHASELWHWCPLRHPLSISGERASQRETDAPTFEFFDAGHVLSDRHSPARRRPDGFHTGDVNFRQSPIMEDAIFPQEKIDILIIECTRGDHAKPCGNGRGRGGTALLAEGIDRAFTRGDACSFPFSHLANPGRACDVL